MIVGVVFVSESRTLCSGIVSKTLTGLVDKGLNKVLDQIEKKTGKHLGFVKKSTVPSAGKDRGNEFPKFKKEAEDFHRKAKKQWTYSKREVGDSFKYYGTGKIPTEQREMVSDLQAEMQKIIDMHTQLEKMMQTTNTVEGLKLNNPREDELSLEYRIAESEKKSWWNKWNK